MGRRLQRVMVTSPVRLAAQVAAVRMLILWTAMLLYLTTADWRQVVGYVGLVGNAFLEMLLVRGLRGHTTLWTIALSVAVVSTSIIVAFLWTAVVNHLRGR
jgi:hypothetical protein